MRRILMIVCAVALLMICVSESNAAVRVNAGGTRVAVGGRVGGGVGFRKPAVAVGVSGARVARPAVAVRVARPVVAVGAVRPVVAVGVGRNVVAVNGFNRFGHNGFAVASPFVGFNSFGYANTASFGYGVGSYFPTFYQAPTVAQAAVAAPCANAAVEAPALVTPPFLAPCP